MGRRQVALLHSKAPWPSWGNTCSVNLNCEPNWSVFHGILFYLKGRLTNDGYLAFSTWQAFFENEQSDPVVSKKTVYNLSCQWKILFFMQKLKFWKTYIHPHDHGRFWIVKYLFDEINGNMNKYDFLISYKKYVNIWHICITLWTVIFQMANTWCYKIMCG